MSWNLIASKDYNLLIASEKKIPTSSYIGLIEKFITKSRKTQVYIYNLQFFFNYVV